MVNISDFPYPCPSDRTNCHSIPFGFSPGLFKIELWGAQGGNSTSELGGRGGYTNVIFHCESVQILYLYVGSSGYPGTQSGISERAVFNGGGRGGHSSASCNGGSGGGSTDIRISSDVETRMIIAGGGGGSGQLTPYYTRGGYGGGNSGSDGENKYDGIAGQRGTQYPSGSNQKGFGGNSTDGCGSGGGGGYWGGSQGTQGGASGGGGSGYISNQSYPFGYIEPVFLLSGNDNIPPYWDSDTTIVGNPGFGYIRITTLDSNVDNRECICSQFVVFNICFMMSCCIIFYHPLS